jgi:uncharacterized membrane protein YeaQ/YmgE (transglycosylase-associated protein family)
MGFWGIILLLAGAGLIGIIERALHNGRSTNELIATSIAAALGGFVASEWLGALSTWGPQANGLYLFPALIGAIVVSAVVELLFRYQTTTQTR